MESVKDFVVEETAGAEGDCEDEIQRKFEAFHRANPNVYSLLCVFGREVLTAGYKRYSIDALYQRLRWHINIELRRDPNDPFKLNNNFRSRYARLIMKQEEDFRDFFELRIIKPEKAAQAARAAEEADAADEAQEERAPDTTGTTEIITRRAA